MSRVKNDTKKEEFEKISNAHIEGKSMKTDVSASGDKKLKPIDLWLEELRQKNEATFK
jgi:hypothetical protein